MLFEKEVGGMSDIDPEAIIRPLGASDKLYLLWLGFGAFGLIFLFIVVAFTLWMFIHGIIRTIKIWPEEGILNLVMLSLMWLLPVIGAIVYYFVCYRKSSVLKNS